MEVTCPGCGTVSFFDQLQRDAAEFCRSCDYPLFWSRSSDIAGGDTLTEGGDSGLRRLPGTGGRVLAASIACRICTEPNPVTGVVCIRCGALLVAPPEPEPVFIPPPLPPPPEPPPPPPKSIVPWVVLGILLVVGLLLLVWMTQ